MQSEELKKKADDLRNDGKTQEAIALYKQLFNQADSAGRVDLAGHALQMIGVCWHMENNWDEASKSLEKASEFYLEHDDKKGAGNTLRDLGIAAMSAQKLDDARLYYQQAIKQLQADFPAEYGITLAKIGLLNLYEGNINEAKHAIADSILVLESAGNWFFLSTALIHLAAVHAQQEEYRGALIALDRAEALYNEHTDEPNTRRFAQIWGGQAYCYAELHELEKAHELFHKAIEVITREHYPVEATAELLRDIRADKTIQKLMQV